MYLHRTLRAEFLTAEAADTAFIVHLCFFCFDCNCFCRTNIRAKSAADTFALFQFRRRTQRFLCNFSEQQSELSRQHCFKLHSSASLNSRLGKEQDSAVTAITRSPSTSWATRSKKVESTPPEKATATLQYSFVLFTYSQHNGAKILSSPSISHFTKPVSIFSMVLSRLFS